MDGLVAPLVFRTLFAAERPDEKLCRRLLAQALS